MFAGSSMTNGNNKMKFKDSTMSTSIHEATKFCSEDDFMMHHGPHSPTDSSEDSVEVKVSTISFNHKKRKLLEKYRQETGPLKKRVCLKVKAEESTIEKQPFRPWSPTNSSNSADSFVKPQPLKVEPFAYFRPPSPVPQPAEQPVSLVIKREIVEERDVRVPVHPQIGNLSPAETERMILSTNAQFPGLDNNGGSNSKRADSKREQRNYKNMTRERRIEANARERTRVHTISAAFDTLRRAVPSYSHNQKLSKLSVLRIACSYIQTLSNIVEQCDDTESIGDCVDMVSRTIQREGKLRKKKEDGDD